MDTVDRRDFLQVAGWAGLGIGAAVAVWPLIQSMAPSAMVQALATTSVDLSAIEEGMAITVVWRGKPVWIRHQTPADVAAAEAVDPANLPDPQTYAERVQQPAWLVQIGICTHLGCIPLGHWPGEPKGAFGGYFCPCHGSHYDGAGRIRKGPARRNLDVPPYAFTSPTSIRIG